MMGNEYESYMMYVWDRLEKLLSYEHTELTYELFNLILDYRDFDIDGVNVSISQYEHFQKLYGKNMFDEMCRTYSEYVSGKMDRNIEKEKENKRRLYKIMKNHINKN